MSTLFLKWRPKLTIKTPASKPLGVYSALAEDLAEPMCAAHHSCQELVRIRVRLPRSCWCTCPKSPNNPTSLGPTRTQSCTGRQETRSRSPIGHKGPLAAPAPQALPTASDWQFRRYPLHRSAVEVVWPKETSQSLLHERSRFPKTGRQVGILCVRRPRGHYLRGPKLGKCPIAIFQNLEKCIWTRGKKCHVPRPQTPKCETIVKNKCLQGKPENVSGAHGKISRAQRNAEEKVSHGHDFSNVSHKKMSRAKIKKCLSPGDRKMSRDPS